MCSHYNIEFIKAQDLANWAAGLEPPLNSYASRFVETKCGSLATMLMDDELIDRSVVPKIGHLINMREKLAFLVRVLYDIKDETVESLVMKYQTGARSLETIIRRRRYEFAPQQVHSATRATVPNNVLSHVCDIMATGRDICSWLIKAPFSDGTGSYKELAETFMQNNREMGYSVVGDRWTHELEDLLVNQCRKMQELCHNFIENCTDSSIITPAFLEQVTLKRQTPDEPLGLPFKSNLEGIICVTNVRPNSVAARTQKIDVFDDIVQIDHTCVLNWTTKSFTIKMKSRNDICLTLRKRPRHFSMNYQFRRMKVMCPPDPSKIIYRQPKTRSRKSTMESKQSSSGNEADLKTNALAVETTRASLNPLLSPDSRIPTDSLSSSYNRASATRASGTAGRVGSLRRRSLSATSLMNEPNKQNVKPLITVVSPASGTPTAAPFYREQMLTSVSSCDPSTSSGALSSDQDSSSVFQTPAVQVTHEKHAVIDRRVSLKDLGETEISGNLFRKKADNDWSFCYCVIKNGYFYVFSSQKAEKADVVVHLKSVDVAKSDQEDSFKFVFTINFTYQQKKYVFAAENRLELGHWVNNLHTAKLLLNSKKTSVAARNTLAVENEVDENFALESTSLDKSFHASSDNFSETDDEDEKTERCETKVATSNESLDLLKYSLLATSGHSPFSRSSTIEESSVPGFPGAHGIPSESSLQQIDSSSFSTPLRLRIPASASSEHAPSSRNSLGEKESEMCESTQSVKLVLMSEINEEAAVKVWEEPRTELDQLKSKLRALERKLLSKESDLAKIESLIEVGEKDPSQMMLSPVYHEETSAIQWHASTDDESSTIDTEL